MKSFLSISFAVAYPLCLFKVSSGSIYVDFIKEQCTMTCD